MTSPGVRGGTPRVLALGRDVGRCFGGAEKVAIELIGRLDGSRFSRYVCVTHARPADRLAVNERELGELEASGVGVLRLERDGAASNAAWKKLYDLLVNERIDVLHAHMPRASVPGAVIGRLARVPVIVSHEHGWDFRGKPVRRFLDRNLVARASDVLLAVSERDRERMVEIERIPAERIMVLPNGIESAPGSGQRIRAELGIEPGVALIGAVGRLYPEKGYEELIRAVSILRSSLGTPLLCVIAGHGPQEQHLRSLISAEGLDDDVRLIGRRDDVPDLIAALDVAVLSSRHEGSPLAVIEYMAQGAAIVATAVGGVPELIRDEVDGLLVAPGDPHALSAGISRLLADPALAARLGQSALERQRANYDLQAVVGRLEALYVELLAKSGRVRRTTDRHV